MPMPVTMRRTEIEDVVLFEEGLFADHRGFFAETYSAPLFADLGFTERFVQDNCSGSARGVLRGLHYQVNPHAMGKLVRVLQGAVYDVAVDLRRGSPTFGHHVGRILSAENRLAMWVPVGFAHGFLALEDHTLVYYKCSAIHTPEAERSLLYRDPEIGIAWPFEPDIVSKKDAEAPPLAQADFNFEYRRRGSVSSS